MKTHFIKMFNYNRYANNLMMQAVIDNKYPDNVMRLFTHLLATERIWLDRCLGTAIYPQNPWPANATVEECKQDIEAHYDAWTAYLNSLTTADFEKQIRYQNSMGHYKTQLSDIVAHVINHGTHTRAQIGQQLKFINDQALPLTDYSYYLRQV